MRLATSFPENANFRDWMNSEGRLLGDGGQHEVRTGIVDDLNALATGQGNQGKPLDGTFELKRFLEAEGGGLRRYQPRFSKRLRPLIMAAHLQHLGRCQDVLKGAPPKDRDDLFRGVRSHSPATEKARVE